jgi:hypothetical protein
MTTDPESILEACWDEGPSLEGPSAGKVCRWCQFEASGEHAPDCPCRALSNALR